MSKVCVVVPHINFANRSNGITVLLELALLISKEESTTEVWIFPTWADASTRTKLPERYGQIELARKLPDADTITIVSETIQPKDLSKIRKTGAFIAWYNLSTPGAFEVFGLPYLKRKPWEIEMSYSSFISLDFEIFFLQPKLKKLDLVIRQKKISTQTESLRQIQNKRPLTLAVYSGKGKWQALPPAISKKLKGANIISIDRHSPASKGLLYNTLLNCDLLISMDSLTNLNAEANLLGCPVYCLNGLPDLAMAEEYPIDLSGTVYTQDDFWYLYDYGYNPSLALSDYEKAVSNNKLTVSNMLKYLSEHHKLIRQQKEIYKNGAALDLLSSSVDAYWYTKAKAWENHFNQNESLKPEFIFSTSSPIKNIFVSIPRLLARILKSFNARIARKAYKK